MRVGAGGGRCEGGGRCARIRGGGGRVRGQFIIRIKSVWRTGSPTQRFNPINHVNNAINNKRTRIGLLLAARDTYSNFFSHPPRPPQLPQAPTLEDCSSPPTSFGPSPSSPPSPCSSSLALPPRCPSPPSLLFIPDLSCFFLCSFLLYSSPSAFLFLSSLLPSPFLLCLLLQHSYPYARLSLSSFLLHIPSISPSCLLSSCFFLSPPTPPYPSPYPIPPLGPPVPLPLHPPCSLPLPCPPPPLPVRGDISQRVGGPEISVFPWSSRSLIGGRGDHTSCLFIILLFGGLFRRPRQGGWGAGEGRGMVMVGTREGRGDGDGGDRRGKEGW